MPGDKIEVDHKAFVYGSNGRRLEVKLSPKVTPMGGRDRMRDEMEPIIRALKNDMKHSDAGDWGCTFCAKPARHTWVQDSSWSHLTPPSVTTYVHLVCTLNPGPCKDLLKAMDNFMINANLAAMDPASRNLDFIDPNAVDLDDLPVVDDVADFALAGTCSNCNFEEERDMNGMQRCSRCKLVRYCSTDCQREDYSRHKHLCKTITSVKFAQM